VNRKSEVDSRLTTIRDGRALPPFITEKSLCLPQAFIARCRPAFNMLGRYLE
jgi:hypothetical protein